LPSGYCRICDPETKEAKATAKRAKWDAERKAQNEKWAAKDARAALERRQLQAFPALLAAAKTVLAAMRDVHDFDHVWLNAPEKPEKTPRTVLQDAIALAEATGRPPC
jgi:hypothetical protein